MRKQLAIVKGDIWAFHEGMGLPLVPAIIMNQPEYYEASITIRLLLEPARGLLSVRRVKLPCQWDGVETYLADHPEIPREAAPSVERGPTDDERHAIGLSAVDPLSIGEATIRKIIRQELERSVGVPRLSFNYRDAALATGYSTSALRLAVRSGDLIASYANSKPVFTLSALQEWVKHLPNEWQP